MVWKAAYYTLRAQIKRVELYKICPQNSCLYLSGYQSGTILLKTKQRDSAQGTVLVRCPVSDATVPLHPCLGCVEVWGENPVKYNDKPQTSLPEPQAGVRPP